MKKQLLFGALFLGILFADAQILINENFNGYTVGNVVYEGGTPPPQGGYMLYTDGGGSTTNAARDVAQIVSSAPGNNVLQMTGADGNRGIYFLSKNYYNLWNTRVAENNILEVEVDINPGAITNSRNNIGVHITTPTLSLNRESNRDDYEENRVFVGFTVTAATGELRMVAYSTLNGIKANHSYPTNTFLPANTVSRIGISYNTISGLAIIKSSAFPAGTFYTATGSTVGEPIENIHFTALSGHTAENPNIAAATMLFDNLVIRASNTDTLLGTENKTILSSLFSIYPNPATNVINIINTDNIFVNNVEIIDVNGRTIKSIKYNNVAEVQFNVADLSSGVYIMKVASDKGTMTKKIVKQ